MKLIASLEKTLQPTNKSNALPLGEMSNTACLFLYTEHTYSWLYIKESSLVAT